MHCKKSEIKDFTIGRVVQGFRRDYGNIYGHVTGFALNDFGEVVIKVKWADGEEGNYHPSTLCVL